MTQITANVWLLKQCQILPCTSMLLLPTCTVIRIPFTKKARLLETRAVADRNSSAEFQQSKEQAYRIQLQKFVHNFYFLIHLKQFKQKIF